MMKNIAKTNTYARMPQNTLPNRFFGLLNPFLGRSATIPLSLEELVYSLSGLGTLYFISHG